MVENTSQLDEWTLCGANDKIMPGLAYVTGRLTLNFGILG